MFEKLFADSGLSLDRLRALLEVNVAGSIVKAAEGDPVKQSQYSRQIRELEDFFQIKLIERHGKGIRLTQNGKELARISRFFLLGLSNFQRGCRAEEQTFSIGACATFIHSFLLPVFSEQRTSAGPRYEVERVNDDEIERRLHDLTLDFGIVTTSILSRPLQSKELGAWRLKLWVPRRLFVDERAALQAFRERRLPIALARREFPSCDAEVVKAFEPRLICESFLEARRVLSGKTLAAVLPDFLIPENADDFIEVPVPALKRCVLQYHLAWNPRLLRLNPHAVRQRDMLTETLTAKVGKKKKRGERSKEMGLSD